MKQSIPIRQCIVCREKKIKPLLFRFVKKDANTIILDEDQKINQRGAYLCNSPDCVKKAKEYHIIENSLKGIIDLKLFLTLARTVATTPADQIQSIIGLSVKSKQIIIGLDAIERAMNQAMIHMILTDARLGEHSFRLANRIAEKLNVPIYSLPPDLDLAQITGKTNCRVVGLTNVHFAHTLDRLLNPKA